jgi:hypothetical protein
MVMKMVTGMMILLSVLFGMLPLAMAGVIEENPFTSRNRGKRKAKYSRVKNMTEKQPEQESEKPLERQIKGRQEYWKIDVKMVGPFIRGPTGTFCRA